MNIVKTKWGKRKKREGSFVFCVQSYVFFFVVPNKKTNFVPKN